MPNQTIGSQITRFWHSVRFRLSLWYLAVLTLALLIFGVAIYSIEERTLTSATDTELNTIGEQLSKVVSNKNGQLTLPPEIGMVLQQISFLNPSENIWGRLLDFPGLKALVNGRYVLRLVNADKEISQQYGALGPEDTTRLKKWLAEQTKNEPKTENFEVLAAPNTTRNEKLTYRLLIYPLKEANTGAVYGTLVVGLWWEGAETLQGLLWTLLGAGLATLVLTAGGGYWLASRAMRPVSQITRIAQTISETDLSRRINLKNRDELGELAATFDGMLNRLENAFERQRQFTADASHELRTPLTIVNLETNRVAGRGRTIEEYERAFAIIQTENDYMTRLVTDLLSLARADSGQVDLHKSSLDLSDLALEIVERLAPLARENNLELTTGELPEIEIAGDRLYLTRMLANLVENALKHSVGCGQTVRIETGSTGKWAWVRITDDGPGIAPAHLPYLFDRFYQVDNARKVKAGSENRQRGSGLGLSIVQWIAQLHGGEVTVSSELGKGTTFEVRLPLATSTD